MENKYSRRLLWDFVIPFRPNFLYSVSWSLAAAARPLLDARGSGGDPEEEECAQKIKEETTC